MQSLSFGPLPPEKRWLLVPPILTRILQTDHATSSPEERQAEVSLIQTCTTFFKQAYMHTLSLKNQPMPPPHPAATGPAPTSQQEFFVRFVKHLLHNFRQCVKSVLVTFMEKNQLRKVLLIDEDLDRVGDADDDHNKAKKFEAMAVEQAKKDVQVLRRPPTQYTGDTKRPQDVG